MQEFFVACLVSALLITVTVLVFYEVLRTAWLIKERFETKPRSMIYLLVVAIFMAHTLCVWIYGLGYWFLADWLHLGELHPMVGHVEDSGAPGSLNRLFMFIYFSVICYSSVGFGDYAPGGVLRLVSGVEAVNGLLLIGWSVTYTYFATERYLSFRRHK